VKQASSRAEANKGFRLFSLKSIELEVDDKKITVDMTKPELSEPKKKADLLFESTFRKQMDSKDMKLGQLKAMFLDLQAEPTEKYSLVSAKYVESVKFWERYKETKDSADKIKQPDYYMKMIGKNTMRKYVLQPDENNLITRFAAILKQFMDEADRNEALLKDNPQDQEARQKVRKSRRESTLFLDRMAERLDS
jgi:hypothetical protein